MLNKKITHFAVITKMKNDGKRTSDLDHNIEKASSYAQKYIFSTQKEFHTSIWMNFGKTKNNIIILI